MEGDAGTRRLNPTEPDGMCAPDVEAPVHDEKHDEMPDAPSAESLDESVGAAVLNEASEDFPAADDGTDIDQRRPSRLGRGWAVAVCAGLVLLAAGAATAGYLALRTNGESQVMARDDAAAVAAAKDCIAATHAPDVAAMSASQAKIVECSTGAFGAQAALYSGILVDAYQAADVRVQVSDMRAAVEKHNTDGSIDVLVAVRVKVTNSAIADQEQGYRLRVQMAPADGTYKISKLDQVTS